MSTLIGSMSDGMVSMAPVTGTPLMLRPVLAGSSSTKATGSIRKSGVEITWLQKAAPASPAPTITTRRRYRSAWPLAFKRSRPTRTAVRSPAARKMWTPHSINGTLLGMPSKSVSHNSGRKTIVETVVAFTIPSKSGTET